VYGSEETPCIPVSSSSCTFYTSEQWKPKGVVRDTGGYAVALLFSMQSIYNVKEGDVFGRSDVGWVVGHSLRPWTIDQ
jgi:propionyl-CoA synthetase